MIRKGRVLIVEDEERWQAVVGDTLRRGGFHVDTAGTITTAHKYLEESFFHLAVLDLHMDLADAGEGMTLLREIRERGLNDSMSVIMLTGKGTKEQMREAFAQYKVTDFLAKKDFDNLEFLNQVRWAFDHLFKINLDLKVHWQQISGPEDAVTNLQLNGKRLKAEDSMLPTIAAELDDLLCRLYHKAESVIVKRLATGHSGAGLLWVQPFYKETGGAQPSVLKFGDFREIAIEFRNWNNYVKSFVSGGRNTAIQDPLGRTPRLGGITYSLLEAPGEQLASFGDFYKQATLPEINNVLTRLFTETCGSWYANAGRLQPYDLTQDYEELMGLSREKIEKALEEKLKSVQGKLQLHFNSLPDRHFTNPVYALDQRFVKPTYVCTTHGDFNESNILVDNTGHSWLIDFRRTGPGHILRDVAELEAIVRLKLLGRDDATLQERLEMEERLCSIQHFSQIDSLSSFAPENEAVAKAYATSVHLRSLARKLVSQNPNDDISEYYIALFYFSINMLRFYYLPTIQREHALLSASLLAEKLTR